MTTTTETYDRDLATAETLYNARASHSEYPDGEYEKTRADRLNNAWVEGITVDEWVRRALGAARD